MACIGEDRDLMKTLTCEARAENIQLVTDFLDRELEALDCSPKAQMQIDVAADEIFANISAYAYTPGVGEATVSFECDPVTRIACIRFQDRGVPYNPLKKEDPDVSLPAEERALGGLGIFLVKKTMDEMEYEYRDGQNILTLRKKI